MKTKEEEVLKSFHDFWSIWALRKNKSQTLNDLLPFFDSTVTALGTGEHEKGRNYKEVLSNFKDDFDELEVPIKMNFFYERARVLAPDVGLVEAECKLEIELKSNKVLHFHLRFTTVFRNKDNRWKIIHNHVSVPYDSQNIGEAYPIDELKARNDRLENQVKERTKVIEEKNEQLKVQKNKTENLLYNILPKIVANELLATGKTEPARYDNATVLFTDFVQFTKLAASIPPRKLIEELNDIFFFFDDVIKQEKLEKIKTIGDSYMAVCGLPEENAMHAHQTIIAAQKMIRYLEERNKNNELKWRMRIGINSGPVVAGVVGNYKFAYDLWGHTVNLASRLESAGEKGKINISGHTYALVKNQIPCHYRGKIQVKGAEKIDMYFVE